MSSPDSELIFRQAAAAVEAAEAKANGNSRDRDFFPEAPGIEFPDVSQGLPDKLWRNLGLDPILRNRIEGEAFFFNHTQPLSLRIDMLTEHILNSLGTVNPPFLGSFLDVLEQVADEGEAGKENYVRNSDEMRFNNLVYGSVLAFEAYQIESDKNVVAGFDKFSSDADVIALFQFKLPEPSWWKKGKIRQMVSMGEPCLEDFGIYRDVQQIARYATRSPIEFGIGAWATASILRTYWPEICSEDLPPYELSSYADLDRGIRGL